MKSAGIALLILFVGVPTISFAACRLPTFEFFPEKNDHVVVTGVIARGTPCVHRLREGPGYRFTSVTSMRDPDHGTLSIAGNATITYQPQKSFDGKDFYAIGACATKADGSSGCSSLFFVLATK